MSEQLHTHTRNLREHVLRRSGVTAIVSDSTHGGTNQRINTKSVQVDAEVCNVAVTHMNADFDALAAAVALTKYWSIGRPEFPSFVCMPTGANDQVSQYLAKHKSLFPVRGLKTLRAEDIGCVGIVDTADIKRIGKAARLLDHAEHVEIYDHHPELCSEIPSACNIVADKLVSAPVGSATTVLVEMLRDLIETQQRQITSAKRSHILTLNEAELSLFALGIHTDTFNFVSSSTKPRDLKAYTWLMEQGASQHAISEFANIHKSPSEDHSRKLTVALANANVTEYEGFKVGVVYGAFGNGRNGANLALDVLNNLGLDVLLLGVFKERKGKNMLSVIGRCSARSPVNLDVLFKKYGGGGHEFAASVALRWVASGDSAAESKEEEISSRMYQLREDVLRQIPKQATAQAIMTKSVIKLDATDTMQDAMDLMRRTKIPSIPVVEGRRILGMIKKPQVVKALRRKEADAIVRCRLDKPKCIHADATLSEIEKALETTSSRLLVVDDNAFLLGMITGTDILAHRRWYKNLHTWHTGFSRQNDDAEWTYELRKASTRVFRRMLKDVAKWKRLRFSSSRTKRKIHQKVRRKKVLEAV